MLKKLSRLLALMSMSAILIAPAILVNLTFIFSFARRTRTLAALATLWAKCSCRILGIRVRPDGDFNKDLTGFIVSNHTSYTDIMVLASLLPCTFLSKEDVRRWPLVGLLSMLAGTVFIDRSSRSGIPAAIKGLNRKLRAGVNAVVFPEGTTSDSSDVMPFKSSFFELPLMMNCPVIPVSIKYRAAGCGQLENPVAWFGNEYFPKHFWRLLGCGNVEATLFFSAPLQYTKGDNTLARKDLAMQAHSIVSKQYRNLSV
ncbi:MAG: 1-acyl-sn-glycerol-3-phosphate acyltransferase [Nitrospiraceae bacterium]|nr:1-acyl-sn-glycerol-3-phosphate acyltransferase [Nitrospiraceae bacterium]